MKNIEIKKLKKGEKFGTYDSTTQGLIKSHRAIGAAEKEVRRQDKMWAGKRTFEVVTLSQK